MQSFAITKWVMPVSIISFYLGYFISMSFLFSVVDSLLASAPITIIQ